jgi:hypothetical protein
MKYARIVQDLFDYCLYLYNYSTCSVLRISISKALKASFIPSKLALASQVPGIRMQTFHASYKMLHRFIFEASYDFHYSTCMKCLRSHPRYLTRARQLAPCKRR